MTVNSLAQQLSDEAPAEDDQRLADELKSGVRAARELVIDDPRPDWSDELPAPLLPHDPLAFEQPPPLPDHEQVLRNVALEALGRGLVRRMF